jgi:S1-C subfamily serine protease
MSGPYDNRDARPMVTWKTVILAAGLVTMIGLIAWPSLEGRIHYARTRAELAAIADAAAGAKLAPIAKLFTTLARLIGPSVVNVTADRQADMITDEIASLRGRSIRSITDESIGSGVIIEADGMIVTNYHVVARADRITVALADGREFAARLVGADPASDLAVLRIDATGLHAAAWGDSDALEVGEMVWAIGNPFGLGRTLTYGIVSAKGRRGVVGNPAGLADDPFEVDGVPFERAKDPFQEFLQTDAAINPGNSGGPLIDVNGCVVGITTAIADPDSQGIGFAIPSNVAREVVGAIEQLGHVERGYLGLALRGTVDGSPGVLAMAAEPGGPGELAGIKPGDVIIGFNGEEVAAPAELVLLLTRAAVGATLPIEISRDGQRRSLSLVVGRRPR